MKQDKELEKIVPEIEPDRKATGKGKNQDSKLHEKDVEEVEPDKPGELTEDQLKSVSAGAENAYLYLKGRKTS